MNKLLGLDNDLLSKVGLVERAGYRLVNNLFLVVIIISILANGYFGYLWIRTWWGALIIGALMGYIHFSVLRIALITLMTKPLVESRKVVAPLPITAGRLKKLFHYVKQLHGASILRFVFVGLIAFTISIPFATLFFHEEALQIEQKYRSELVFSFKNHQVTDDRIIEDLEAAHYPFVIFEKLSNKGSYRLLLLTSLILVFAPVVALARLRYGKHNMYAEICREKMYKDVVIEYHECIEQSQFYLEKNYPIFNMKLQELNPYADPPFRTSLRRGSVRDFGGQEEFRQYIRSL